MGKHFTLAGIFHAHKNSSEPLLSEDDTFQVTAMSFTAFCTCAGKPVETYFSPSSGIP
jgi:hypothetical protein